MHFIYRGTCFRTCDHRVPVCRQGASAGPTTGLWTLAPMSPPSATFPRSLGTAASWGCRRAQVCSLLQLEHLHRWRHVGSPNSDSSSHLPFSVSAPPPHPRLLFLKQILDSTLSFVSISIRISQRWGLSKSFKMFFRNENLEKKRIVEHLQTCCLTFAKPFRSRLQK